MIGQVHVIRGNNTIYHTKGCKKKTMKRKITVLLQQKENTKFVNMSSNCHVFVLDLSILDPFIET